MINEATSAGHSRPPVARQIGGVCKAASVNEAARQATKLPLRTVRKKRPTWTRYDFTRSSSNCTVSLKMRHTVNGLLVTCQSFIR